MSSSILQQLEDDKHELEMTPMIDVTFLLLIFFMCTLKFKTLEGKLAAYLPKDVGGNPVDQVPIDKVEIRIKVIDSGTRYLPGTVGGERLVYGPGATGRYVWGEDRVIEYSVATFKTRDLERLRGRLTEVYRARIALEADVDVPVTIDAREGTDYEDVVEVLDQAVFAGFRKITFVGARPVRAGPVE